ncbi:GNAT family N-acetyltransferase [Limnohabitans sp.]|jgi:GNAT superfamily N-acetyltransferase|uniref:GNAT family N-acetyltransferase n=1 Tax=Limnohabitans sp. TaxID=1907725 RepID=UPI0037BF8884
MNIDGPLTGIEDECERVLRTLPDWFGIEESLLEYANATLHMPTFVIRQKEQVIGFLSLKEHFRNSWEVNCIAVDIGYRGQGLGKKLHKQAELWLASNGATTLQVKTLASSHPSKAYAQTREFYCSLGYQPIEVFPALWAAHLPVLQLVKVLASAA